MDKKILDTATVLIASRESMLPAFELKFYGVSARELQTVPTGGEIVRAALRKRNLNPDDFISSPFWVY